MAEQKQSHVIVIGGGVIGASSAYFLRQAGYRVTLIDKNTLGSECSHGNCGLICPSDALPLASPGAVSSTLKTLFKRHNPLYIKPRFSPRLWLWLVKFALRCNQRHMLQAAEARMPLLESSLHLYQSLIEREQIECEWQKNGLLYVYKDQAAMDSYQATDDFLTKHFSLPARRFDTCALSELEPVVAEDVAGGWYYEEDAHLRPDRLMSEWKRVLQNYDVDVREGTEVFKFKRKGIKATGVLTRDGVIEADKFVLAVGAISPQWEKEIGADLPIQPGKGYSLTYPKPQYSPRIPMIFPQHRVVMTPMLSGYRLGSTMEFSGYDTSINRRRIELLKKGAEPYLREPYGDYVEEEWYGWRPMIYHGIPIIDTSPRMDNVLVATGHNMLGLSMGPATGKLVSELVAGEPTHVSAKPYQLLSK
ncbi:MAG: NAD(P)/FAD-dependent oxidoreductase [Pirellulaceae bacterium]|nr:FAD-dependent oxidoreductase [Pirellulaceae bacterium]